MKESCSHDYLWFDRGVNRCLDCGKAAITVMLGGEGTAYIAGPMSGVKDFNYPTFHDAAAKWQGECKGAATEIDHEIIARTRKPLSPFRRCR